MYHERQRLMHCAIHTLNNLFQEQWAGREMMDRLALELCNREELLRSESGMRRMLTNPFKSVIPLIGDYDINVVLEALKLRQCRVSLHAVFNPKNPEAFELALTEAVSSSPSPRGIIVNYVSQRRLWGAWVNHHFYAIISLGGGGIGGDGGGGGVDGGVSGGVGGGGGGGGGGIDDGDGDGGGGSGGGGGDSGGVGGGDSGGDDGGGCSGGVGCGGGGHPQNHECIESAVSVGGDGGGVAPPAWYSLDSSLVQPKRLGGTRGLLAHLLREVRENNGHVFVVHDGLEAG
ncbi:unnamed protein product [Laminaria digitata]